MLISDKLPVARCSLLLPEQQTSLRTAEGNENASSLETPLDIQATSRIRTKFSMTAGSTIGASSRFSTRKRHGSHLQVTHARTSACTIPPILQGKQPEQPSPQQRLRRPPHLTLSTVEVSSNANAMRPPTLPLIQSITAHEPDLSPYLTVLEP